MLRRYKMTVSTSSLHAHLSSKHGVDTTPDTTVSAAQQSLTKFFGAQRSSANLQRKLTHDIFLWFANALLPFSVIEADGTKLFLAKYCSISPEEVPGRMAVARAGNCLLIVVNFVSVNS
jgi:hypothetical protein